MTVGEKPSWTSILQSVSTTKSVKTRNLLLYGSKFCGKSSVWNGIVSQLDADPSQKKIALAYNYIDLKDNDDDVYARLGAYLLQQNISSSQLLSHPLKSNPKVLLLLDWTNPWSFISKLNIFLHDLEMHSDLADPASVERVFRSYGNPTLLKTDNTTNQNIKNPERHDAADTDDEDMQIPLGDGILTRNNGIQIIIVVTKSDTIPQLEKKNSFREEQFDFIQQSLRTIALKHGAALFYTSKQNESLKLLKGYILHLCWPSTFPTFDVKPLVVDRDFVLVPSGWDTQGKIKALRDDFNFDLVDDDLSKFEKVYEANLPPKRDVTAALNVEAVVSAEDEQTFLGRHVEVEDVGAKLARLAKLKEGSGDSATTPPVVPSVTNTTSTSPPATSGAPTSGGGDSSTEQNEVLANFFQSLLNKGNSSPSATRSRPSGGAPTTEQPPKE